MDDRIIFVAEAPTIEISGGIVYVRSSARTTAWQPGTLRAFVDGARRQLDAFDRAQHGPVPIRPIPAPEPTRARKRKKEA